MTSDLTLTCQLNTSSVINNVHNSGHPEDCDVTETSDEIDYVSSIAIMTESGEELASVTEHRAPRLAVNDVTNIAVSGNLTGGDDVRG